MAALVGRRSRWCVVVALFGCTTAVDVWFFNNHSAPYDIFWDPLDGSELVAVATVEGGGNLTQTTQAGHVFTYEDADGEWQRHLVEATTAHIVLLSSRGKRAVDAVFRNEMASAADLYWEPPGDGVRVKVATIEGLGGQQVQLTHSGQTFSYDDAAGERRFATVDADRAFVVMSPEVIRVSCTLQRLPAKQTLDFEIFPQWAPRGAARFLELARSDFFSGVALHRVIDDFVASFGVHPAHHVRTAYHENPIVDDVHRDGNGRGNFEAGTLSFAGHARNTRTTNLFFVMPGASDDQKRAFGDEPWDTPIGRVAPGSFATVVPLLNRTSETAPWGAGPDPDKLFKWGYEYIDRAPFKDAITRLDTCTVAEAFKNKFPGHAALRKGKAAAKSATTFLKRRFAKKDEL